MESRRFASIVNFKFVRNTLFHPNPPPSHQSDRGSDSTRTLVLLMVGLALLSQAQLSFPQDTRHVAKPNQRPVCATINARLSEANDALPEADENRLDTARIQNAIDRCAPGTAVELRAVGNHAALLSGPLELKGGITLQVDAGTTLFASRNPRDYDVTAGSCGTVNNRGQGCRPLIHVYKAPNAGVMGKGTIDGRGGATLIGQKVSWWDLAQKAKREKARQNVPRLIVAEQSDNFTLYEITLRNSPNFHVIVKRTNGFTAWGVKIDSPGTSRNTDGIDPSSSRNVSILHSYIRCGDDDVAIKAGADGPAAHITVAHDHFYSGHGMSIGSETVGGVDHIVVRDLTIDGADNGLRIKSDATRGGLVREVSYDNICMRDVKNPILMDPFYSARSGPHIPEFQDIRLHHVVVTTAGRITLLGHDATHLLKMTLDGVRMEGGQPQGIRAAHARIALGPGPVNFIPTGEDVRVRRVGGESRTFSCAERFVAFPHGDADSGHPDQPRHPKRHSRPFETEPVIVSADGSGDYRSLQRAIDALPPSGGTIRLRPGLYREVVTVNKPHVRLEGAADPSKVVIVFNKSHGTAGGTIKSATMTVMGDGFFAEGITVANDFSVNRPLKPEGSQAVALAVKGDRAVFRNVRFLGAQDTLYVGSKSCASERGPCVPARQYFFHCYIEGNVDFVFGDAKAFFMQCEIHALPHDVIFLTAQSKHYPAEESGFVFERCTVTADPAARHIFLGRPWRPYSTVVFLNTDLAAHIEPSGWREWHPGETHSLETAFYAEYHSNGAGANAELRDPHTKQLSTKEAQRYSLKEFLSGQDHWNPMEVR